MSINRCTVEALAELLPADAPCVKYLVHVILRHTQAWDLFKQMRSFFLFWEEFSLTFMSGVQESVFYQNKAYHCITLPESRDFWKHTGFHLWGVIVEGFGFSWSIQILHQPQLNVSSFFPSHRCEWLGCLSPFFPFYNIFTCGYDYQENIRCYQKLNHLPCWGQNDPDKSHLYTNIFIDGSVKSPCVKLWPLLCDVVPLPRDQLRSVSQCSGQRYWLDTDLTYMFFNCGGNWSNRGNPQVLHVLLNLKDMERAYKLHTERPCPSWESNRGPSCHEVTVLTTVPLLL